jgi:hypothetical protein
MSTEQTEIKGLIAITSAQAVSLQVLELAVQALTDRVAALEHLLELRVQPIK